MFICLSIIMKVKVHSHVGLSHFGLCWFTPNLDWIELTQDFPKSSKIYPCWLWQAARRVAPIPDPSLKFSSTTYLTASSPRSSVKAACI